MTAGKGRESSRWPAGPEGLSQVDKPAGVRPLGAVDVATLRRSAARLEAGHELDLHVDGESSNPLVRKIHVPLDTNPRAIRHVDGADFHLEVGQGYEVNNPPVPHGAFNGGETDRIHLIFEVFDGART